MEVILVLLIILWFLGYITIPGVVFPRFPLFFFRGHPISLRDILIFFLVIWAIDGLPYPFRTIFVAILLLWILSAIGIIAIAGFSNILVIGLILGFVISLLAKRSVD